MDISLLKEYRIDQIGVVVVDVDATIKQFNKLFGICNFEIINYPDATKEKETFYKGKSACFSIKVGFVNLRFIDLELIQPLSGESIYLDFLNEHGPGIHHFRISLGNKDFNYVCSHLKQEGIEILSQGPGVRSKSKWIVFATREYLGTDIELRNA